MHIFYSFYSALLFVVVAIAWSFFFDIRQNSRKQHKQHYFLKYTGCAIPICRFFYMCCSCSNLKIYTNIDICVFSSLSIVSSCGKLGKLLCYYFSWALNLIFEANRKSDQIFQYYSYQMDNNMHTILTYALNHSWTVTVASDMAKNMQINDEGSYFSASCVNNFRLHFWLFFFAPSIHSSGFIGKNSKYKKTKKLCVFPKIWQILKHLDR